MMMSALLLHLYCIGPPFGAVPLAESQKVHLKYWDMMNRSFTCVAELSAAVDEPSWGWNVGIQDVVALQGFEHACNAGLNDSRAAFLDQADYICVERCRQHLASMYARTEATAQIRNRHIFFVAGNEAASGPTTCLTSYREAGGVFSSIAIPNQSVLLGSAAELRYTFWLLQNASIVFGVPACPQHMEMTFCSAHTDWRETQQPVAKRSATVAPILPRLVADCRSWTSRRPAINDLNWKCRHSTYC